MKVLITQSNYIPWKGYFDAISQADCFVIYDDVQYTRRDWRNRNRIKTPQGLQWLSIPVQSKGKYTALIQEMEVISGDWAALHWDRIRHAYCKAPHFEAFAEVFEGYFQEVKRLTHLSEINRFLLEKVCEWLDIQTPFANSADFQKSGNASERLLQICQQLQATTYLSGPAAQAYLDVGLFDQFGIQVQWIDYQDYPSYPQLHGAFEEKVSIIDLLVHAGKAANTYLNTWKEIQ